MKRSVLITIPVVLVTLVAVLLVAPGFIDWSQYKIQIQDQIKTTTGHTAELRGAISMAFLPTPHVSISDVEVAAPAGSSADYLMKLSRLDVHLAFIPLLSGRIDFDSVTLKDPAVALEVLADGRKNWMTPELERMQNGGGGSARQVSLQKVTIEKGAFTYTDRSKKDAAPMAFNDINIDAKADTLQGPFALDGSFALQGHMIELTADAGAMDGSGAVTVKAEGTVKPSGLAFKYAGVVGTGEPFQMQGETALNVDSLKDLTGNKDLPFDDLKLSGLVTATKYRVDFKNAQLEMGGNKFSGDAGAVLSPLKIAADFKASDTVSIDKFIKGGGSKAGAGAPLLPQTLTLPMAFEAGVRLTAPAMIWQKQVYDRVEILLSKQDKVFAADVMAGSIPGKGKLDAKASIKFAAKSAGKGGVEVYSEPSLIVNVKADTQNIRQSAEALSAMDNLEFLNAWKSGSVDATINVAPEAFTFSNTQIKLGESAFNVSGSYGSNGAIDMTVSGQASDAKALAKALGMDVASLPQALQGATLAVAAKGTNKNLKVNADIKAMNGNLIVQGDVDDPFGKAAISNMAVQAKHPNLAEAIQAFSPGSTRYVSLEKPLDAYAEVEQSGKLYTLKNLKANVAGTPVTGSLSVDTGAAKPTLRGDLTFQNLVIQTGAAAAGVPKSGEKWSPEAIDTAWMNGIEADLAVKADSILYQSWDLQKPVLNVALHGGKLDVSKLDAGLFGGQMAVTAMLQPGSGNKGFSDVESTATFRSVSLEPLVKAMAGSRIIQASGDADLDMKVSTAGISQLALVSGLTGTATTNGRKLVFQGFDLGRFTQTLSQGGKPKDTLGGLWQSTMNGGSTAFDTMDGAFDIENGIATITKLAMDGPQVGMSSQGTVNLPRWTLDTTHTVTVKTPPAAGEKPVPPFAFKVAGSLDNPAQTLGQGVLNNYINSKITDVISDRLGKDNSPLGKVLGGVLGVPVQQPAPAPAPAPVAATPQAAPAPDAAAPAAGEEAAVPPPAEPAAPLTAQQKKELKKQQQQEAIQNLLQGVIGGQ